MLDFLRNLTKSEEEKRQEALNAYLDDALAPEQRQQVESELLQDAGLKAELDQMRLLQQQMRQLPQRRVRRNFTLDPALYGRPQREPLVQAYPVLRTATVMAAFFFIIALTANLFLNGATSRMTSAEPALMEEATHAEMVAEGPVEEEEAVAAEMSTDFMEEAADPPITAEDMVADSEFAMPEEEEPPFLEPVEREAETVAPTDGGAAAEEQKAESPAADVASAVMPTMSPEGTAEAGLAAEVQAVATVVLMEPAPQPEPGLADETGAGEAVIGEDDARSAREFQIEEDEGSFLLKSLGLIVLLLGIVFVILIMLTLLARRRL